MNAIIEARGLTKSFGAARGIVDVNLRVERGRVVGFLGPNGAGKSTTMNLLMGLTNSTAGSARIFGIDVRRRSPRLRSLIGFLSNDMALDGGLTGEQQLRYFGKLNGGYDAAYVAELAKRLGIDLSRKIKTLSRGNHQKIALIAALLHKPKLLILDEPTSGLDPLVQSEFNKIIGELNRQGVTVFISSHILSEVDELCDEFVFIREGRVVAQLDKSRLAELSGERALISLTRQNRAKVIKLLDYCKLDYQIETGDLEAVFMKYYKEAN
jgi:ABC-2 type transport system ATP-binding protein